MPHIRGRIMGSDLTGWYLLARVGRNPGDRTTRNFNYKPTTPLIELKSQKLNGPRFGSAPKVRQRSSKSSNAKRRYDPRA
jgi:hypothetical protein